MVPVVDTASQRLDAAGSFSAGNNVPQFPCAWALA